MSLDIRHFNHNKKEIIRKINHLNRMKYPLNLKRSNHLFVGFLGNQPICFLGLNQRSGHYYFRGCFVQKDQRGRGYQRELIDFACHEARLWGVKRITSLVEVTNYRSLNNALRCGFQIDRLKKKSIYHITKNLSYEKQR